MAYDKLASSVVRSLSHYLVHKKNAPAAYQAPLEILLGHLEAKFSDAYMAETLSRFKDHPDDTVTTNALQLHIKQAVGDDASFRRELERTLGGQPARSRTRRTVLVITVGMAVVVALVVTVVIVQSNDTGPAAGPGATVTSVVTVTESTSTTTSTTTDSASAAPNSSATVAGVPEILGDGSSLPEGTKVHLTDLPLPNDRWDFEHGDHDVRFTQYSNSMWDLLVSCSPSQTSGEQQFNLKNFSRIKVDAVGVDSTSDSNLTITFAIFVNNDDVDPLAEVVVGPGAVKPLEAELPTGVFAVTLRASLTQPPTGNECPRANAVWGSPHVVASGS